MNQKYRLNGVLQKRSPTACLAQRFAWLDDCQSDVWSFGVVLWEVFTFGEVPYPQLTNAETVEFVKNGNRMALPPKSPEAIQNLILECWQEKPEDRPNFKKVLEIISETFELASVANKPIVSQTRKLPAPPGKKSNPQSQPVVASSSFYRL